MCLFVHHNHVPCKSGSTDRDAICGPTRVRLRDDELDGVHIGTTSEWNYAMTVMWTVATVTLATCFFIQVRNHNSCICILAASLFNRLMDQGVTRRVGLASFFFSTLTLRIG